MSCYGVLKVCIRTLSGTARARAGTSLAVIAQELPLFPFRTEKLSPLVPMVLGAQAPGRVGRRRILQGPYRGPFSWTYASVWTSRAWPSASYESSQRRPVSGHASCLSREPDSGWRCPAAYSSASAPKNSRASRQRHSMRPRVPAGKRAQTLSARATAQRDGELDRRDDERDRA